MPALTEKQRKRIEQIIKDHHLAFQVEALGPTAVSEEDLKRLTKAGLVKLPSATHRERTMVTMAAAHELGVLAARVGEKGIEKLTNKEFWDYIEHAPPKLTPHEREAILAARDKVGRCITGLSDKMLGELDRAAHDEDAKMRRGLLTTVRREIAEGLLRKRSVQEIAAALRKKTKDAHRDWEMIAHTEVHNALEEGKANAILNQLPPGSDPMVFKRPRPDACAYCKLLFLDGKRPRVFRLSELSSNGTNQGRRAKRPVSTGKNATEWLPVLGAVHPWCQCQLHMLPEGFEFTKTGELVYTARKALSDMTPALAELLDHRCT